MRSHFASLGKDTLVYGMGSVALRLAPIVALPVYGRAFSPAEFGVLELATVTYTLLLLVLDLGLASGCQRSYFDYDESADGERRLIVSTAFLSIATVSLLTALAFAVFRKPLAELIFGDADRANLVVLLALMVPVALPGQFFREVMRLTFQPWRYLAANLTGAAATIAVGVTAVVVFDAGVEGALLGQIAGFALAAVYGWWIVRRRLSLRFSASHLRTMLVFGLPFLPTSAAFWVVAMIDRYMLEKLSTASELGQYALANRITSVMPMVLLGVSAAFTPYLMRLWSEDPEAEKAVRGRSLTYVSVVICSVLVVMSLFAREIIRVVAPDFDDAFRVVGLVMLGAGAYGVCSITAFGMTLTRRTPWLVVFSSAAAAVNVGLNFALIPAWGMIGAGVATAVAYALAALLYYTKSQQLYPTPYEPRKLLRLLAFTLPIAAVGAIAFPNEGVALAIKVLLVGLFPVGLVVLGIVDRGEVRGLTAYGRALFSGRSPAEPAGSTT